MRSEEAAPLLASVWEEERYSTWWLVEPDGTLHGRGDGLVALGGRIFAPLAPFYGLVARNRGRLGRFVPDRPGPRRFP